MLKNMSAGVIMLKKFDEPTIGSYVVYAEFNYPEFRTTEGIFLVRRGRTLDDALFFPWENLVESPRRISSRLSDELLNYGSISVYPDSCSRMYPADHKVVDFDSLEPEDIADIFAAIDSIKSGGIK